MNPNEWAIYLKIISAFRRGADAEMYQFIDELKEYHKVAA